MFTSTCRGKGHASFNPPPSPGTWPSISGRGIYRDLDDGPSSCIYTGRSCGRGKRGGVIARRGSSGTQRQEGLHIWLASAYIVGNEIMVASIPIWAGIPAGAGPNVIIIIVFLLLYLSMALILYQPGASPTKDITQGRLDPPRKFSHALDIISHYSSYLPMQPAHRPRQLRDDKETAHPPAHVQTLEMQALASCY